MTPPLFQPSSRLESAFSCVIASGRFERDLDVFRWEDRLVAREDANGMWWGTLDACGDRDAREFWDECVANERVGRLFSHLRGFQMAKENRATLLAGKRLFHVLVAQDNGGFARVEEETEWHRFSAVEPSGIRKTGANRPTIWSRGFQIRFARSALPALDPLYEQEVVGHLPEPLHALWSQGAGAYPIRLIAAAFALGWVHSPYSQSNRFPLPTLQFWKEVVARRSGLPLSRAMETLSLPDGLLQSPEVEMPGWIMRSWDYSRQCFSETAIFVWHGPDVLLRVEFRVAGDSAHERLESSLELRDWLIQFFPSREVESWFGS